MTSASRLESHRHFTGEGPSILGEDDGACRLILPNHHDRVEAASPSSVPRISERRPDELDQLGVGTLAQTSVVAASGAGGGVVPTQPVVPLNDM